MDEKQTKTMGARPRPKGNLEGPTKAEKKWLKTEYHVHMGKKQIEKSASGDHRKEGNKIDKKKYEYLKKNIERVEQAEHGMRLPTRFERSKNRDLIGGEHLQ
mmetsp:Transcript_22957/g.35400  ORF Transcript_22957/g.35400 Transcript_22957/m.35400 type:complete len:102 (+) Transcript_22957:97-402(+)